MNGIQILLIFGVSIIAIYYLVRLRKTVLDILVVLILVSAAILFILLPDLANTVAHALGVGRGADLLEYLFILLFSFALLKLYARIRRLEKQFTELVREDALKNPRGPSKEH